VLERDGLTQSLLSMFLTCRQKARFYLSGWNSKYCSEALTFGSLCHGMLELAYLDIQSKKLTGTPSAQQIRRYGGIIEKKWNAENPRSSVDTLVMVEKSLAVLEQMVPRYFDFWKEDFKKMKWVSLEGQFDVRARPGPGLAIRVRGKQDGKFSLKKELWLFETKTKSMVNEGDLLDTLSLDLQVRLYLWAMREGAKTAPTGCLYNIIRKTAAKQGKNESIPKFARRVAEDIDDRPEFYFMRLEVATSRGEIEEFEGELFGLLRDFAAWRNGKLPHYKNPNNCIGKYGRCEYINVCARNDYSTLVKRKIIFKELSDY